MGLDELVDDTEDDIVEEEASGLMKKLGVDSVEELEELEDRFGELQNGFVHYDKRMEELENRVEVLEGVVSKLIKKVSDEDSDNGNDESQTSSWSTESMSESSSSGLEWNGEE